MSDGVHSSVRKELVFSGVKIGEHQRSIIAGDDNKMIPAPSSGA